VSATLVYGDLFELCLSILFIGELFRYGFKSNYFFIYFLSKCILFFILLSSSYLLVIVLSSSFVRSVPEILDCVLSGLLSYLKLLDFHYLNFLLDSLLDAYIISIKLLFSNAVAQLKSYLFELGPKYVRFLLLFAFLLVLLESYELYLLIKRSFISFSY